jgi:hypothetical protein
MFMTKASFYRACKSIVATSKEFVSHRVTSCPLVSNLRQPAQFSLLCCLRFTMGRLVIAHHKSYHPYRRDNVERVRRDEEEARQKEEKEEGRMMLAVCAWAGI